MYGRSIATDLYAKPLQIVIIVSLSVTIAMYCLIQLYVVVSEQLAPFRPLLKLFAIKAVGRISRLHVPMLFPLIFL